MDNVGLQELVAMLGLSTDDPELQRESRVIIMGLAAKEIEDGRHSDDPGIVRLRRIFADVTYKPGTVFMPVILVGKPAIQITLPVTPLSERTGTAIMSTVSFHAATPEAPGELDDLSDEDVVNAVFDQVKKGEIHEVLEWFRYQGRHLVEPHPELANA